MVSRIAMNRIVEDHIAADPKYRSEIERRGRPVLSDLREKPEQELTDWLEERGLALDRENFEALARRFASAQELTDWVAEERSLELEGWDSDVLWMALTVLWDRWLPERPSFEMVDERMQEGYTKSRAESSVSAATHWLWVWDAVLSIMDERGIESIEDFDLRFQGTQSVFNWIQDVDLELAHAGIDDERFYHEGIRFCQGYLDRFSEEDLTTENMKRGLASFYAELGQLEKVDELFLRWLELDRQWGWGWVGWSDCYHLLKSPPDSERAEGILQEGLAVPGVRDEADLVDRLATLYSDLGHQKEAKKARRRLKNTSSSVPAKSRKIGRNAPCPCGSGKKYKKCCGA